MRYGYQSNTAGRLSTTGYPPENKYIARARVDGKSVRFEVFAGSRAIAWHTAMNRLMYLFSDGRDSKTDVMSMLVWRAPQ